MGGDTGRTGGLGRRWVADLEHGRPTAPPSRAAYEAITLCLSAARIRGRELGASLALIEGVYQPARRGSKAVIVWQPSGERQDTWFWGWQAKTGVYVVIRGGTGWGPHNRNPAVMYVEHEGVLDVIDPRALRSWTRRNSRLVERARSEMSEVDNS